MTRPGSSSLGGLNLSWPHFFTYDVDYNVEIAEAETRSPHGGRKAATPATDIQKPVTTYNGVPREDIKNAQPLIRDEIRVLDLKKGTHGMPLEGSLRKVRLSDHDGYEPLSYTWEDYDTGQPSNGNVEDDVLPALFLLDTDRYLNITSNCAKALCSIRKSTEDRTVWVDSVCVNQDDPEERSHQVNMMKKIYATAFTVLVYLGRESSENGSSSSLAMKLLGQPERLQISHRLDPYEITSLKRLFERRYFQRMWIVQEVALARTLEFHCGPDVSYVSEFAGKPLEAILGSLVTPPWLRHSKQIGEGQLSAQGFQVSQRRPDRHPTSQGQQILDLIFDTALCGCKDDRDRIFGVLSLLDSRDRERLRADYNLSTAQIYSGLAAYLATEGLLWGVLMLARRLAPISCPGLPSWVPNWNSIGKSGINDLDLLKEIAFKSERHSIENVWGIDSSGVITLHGMLLGPVIYSGHSRDHLFDNAQMDKDQQSTADLFANECEPGCSHQMHGDTSIWTFAGLSHEMSRGSWGCGFKFLSRCEHSNDAHYRAFMLPDYSTLLILRLHDRFRHQYTLVEIGTPLVGAELPNDWEMPVDRNLLQQLHLRLLKPMASGYQSRRDIILSSKESFPRLSDYPQLWSYNPLTLTMSLTHMAIEEIRRTDIRELHLLQRWRDYSRVGMRILSDNTRFQQLIDEVSNLGHEDYGCIVEDAGLGQMWSLDDFLGLFIRDPRIKVPMEWPDVRLNGDQSLDEVDNPKMNTLSQLMHWAKVTRQILILLGKEIFASFKWQEPLMDKDLYSKAMAVTMFQISVANDFARSGASSDLDRALFLLRRISRQTSDQANSELERVRTPRSNERYWDWGRFNSVMEQRFSFLSHIQPDVERIQEDLRGFEPDFKVITAHQVFAAHGFDPRKEEFTMIQIR